MSDNKKVYVFDIDGTLADIGHRVHFVKNKPKNWKAFNASMSFDKPYHDMVDMVRVCYSVDGSSLVLCSGRGSENRFTTVKWLAEHNIPYHALYMRAEKDYRKDSIIKVELLNQIRKDFGEPFMWFDDRNQVVEAIRAEGVRVLQVREGNF